MNGCPLCGTRLIYSSAAERGLKPRELSLNDEILLSHLESTHTIEELGRYVLLRERELDAS